MEDYAAKMALKPAAELRQYVTDHAQYREEAVLAALTELRQRGQPAPEEETLRPQLEAAVQQTRAKAATQATLDAEAAELPRLYSPAGIVVISATITVVAGAVLLAINMHRRKHGSAIVGLVAFVVAYILGEVFLLKWLVGQNLFSPLVALLADFPLIMTYVWWFWPRYVGTYQFQPRNWLLPLAGCFLLKMVLAYTLLQNPETKKQLEKQVQLLQQR